MGTGGVGSPVVVVVVRCPAEPIQQEEKGCGAGVGQVVRSQRSPGFRLHPVPHTDPCGHADPRGRSLRPHRIRDAPATPGLPKPCLAHLTEGGAAKGCRLDQLAVFVDMDQVLAEGPAPRHMDNGHAVLEQKPRHQAGAWGLLHPPPRPSERMRERLTQAESAKDTSGKLMVKYSFRVHTATTSVPAAVKKASNPEPLLVKKLGTGSASYTCGFPARPYGTAPGSLAITHL